MCRRARDPHQLLRWMRAAFIESNPIPAKAGLAMMGKMKNVLRLPLVPLADTHSSAVRTALADAGALRVSHADTRSRHSRTSGIRPRQRGKPLPDGARADRSMRSWTPWRQVISVRRNGAWMASGARARG